MKWKVFYEYFKFFIWLFVFANIIDSFVLTKDKVSLLIFSLQELVFLFFFIDTYQTLELPAHCQKWKDYYDSLLELKKQGMTKEDKKILELFIPPD